MAALDPKMDVFLRRQLRGIGSEYASLSKEVKSSLSTIFEKYADAEGRVNYADLSKYGRLDKFRDEIKSTVSQYQTRVDNKIRGSVKDMYTKSYQDQMLGIKTVLPDVKLGTIPPIDFPIAAVQNDMSGMVLNDRLREHRADIIRRINADLTQGIHRGDTYGTMAKSVSEVLEKDFVKASRIVRTEGHRVYEQARHDASIRVSEKTGHTIMKRWVSSRDERVRDTHAAMDGQEVPVDEDFVNPQTGGRGPHPGALGTAEDDINCRCTMVTYVVASDVDLAEEDTGTGTVNNVPNYNTEEPPAAWNPQELVATHKAQYGDVTFDSLAKKGSLDKNTANAFRYYKRHGYTDINGALRGKSPASKSTSARIETMDKWFSQKAVTVRPEGEHVWRGVSPRVADELVAVGRVQDPGFSSTSYQPHAASGFARKRDTPSDGILNLMRVHVPGGEPIMTWENEAEILLGRGKTFELLAIENIPPGQARSMGLFGNGVRVLHCILK